MAVATPSQQPPGVMSWSTRIAWMVCAMPELLKSFAWDAFVLFYYAQVVGLDGRLLGVAIAVIILFDTFADPWIGAWSDRLRRAPFGRRHTLMLAAIAPFAIGVAGVFSPPSGLEQWQVLGWLLGFGLLTRCGISLWTVPAYALGGDLSVQTKERRLIAVLRNLGNQVVILAVPFVAFEVFFVRSDAFPKPQLNPEPYPGFGLFVAGLGVVLMLIGALGTMGHVRRIERLTLSQEPAPSEGALKLIARFWNAVRVTPNIGRLFLVAFLVLFTNSVINQLSLHLATYFWKLDASWTPRMLMAATFGSILAMILAPLFLKLFSTFRAMTIGLGVFFVAQAAAVVLPLSGLAPVAGSEAMGGFISALRFLGGLAYGLYVVPFNVTTYDIGDEHEANTGEPAQGIVASFMFIGLQLGSGAVALLAGSFLGVIAFPAGLPVDLMPAGKVQALALFVLALIALAGSSMAWLVGTVRVDPERVARVRAAREAAAGQSGSD